MVVKISIKNSKLLFFWCINCFVVNFISEVDCLGLLTKQKNGLMRILINGGVNMTAFIQQGFRVVLYGRSIDATISYVLFYKQIEMIGKKNIRCFQEQ